jgi:hypothetical protein
VNFSPSISGSLPKNRRRCPAALSISLLMALILDSERIDTRQ